MSRFPSTPVKLYRDFPDVFDPIYQQAAQQLESVKIDRCLIGYFLQYEPHWAFGDNNLAFEMFAKATLSFTIKERSKWLQKKNTIVLKLLSNTYVLFLTKTCRAAVHFV